MGCIAGAGTEEGHFRRPSRPTCRLTCSETIGAEGWGIRRIWVAAAAGAEEGHLLWPSGIERQPCGEAIIWAAQRYGRQWARAPRTSGRAATCREAIGAAPSRCEAIGAARGAYTGGHRKFLLPPTQLVMALDWECAGGMSKMCRSWV